MWKPLQWHPFGRQKQEDNIKTSRAYKMELHQKEKVDGFTEPFILNRVNTSYWISKVLSWMLIWFALHGWSRDIRRASVRLPLALAVWSGPSKIRFAQ
jgi:hypothetical protein